MGGWGYWAPSGGQFGLSDTTMSSMAAINYSLPYNFANKPGAISDATSFDNAAESILRINAFGSMHEGGAQFALGDGSSRFISENINAGILRSLSTRAVGEVVGEY